MASTTAASFTVAVPVVEYGQGSVNTLTIDLRRVGNVVIPISYGWTKTGSTSCTACIDDYRYATDTNDWQDTKACFRAYIRYGREKGTSSATDVVNDYARVVESDGSIRIPKYVIGTWVNQIHQCHSEWTTDCPARVEVPPPSLSLRLKDIIDARQSPMIITRRNVKSPLPPTNDARELRARDTLRRLIGEESYEHLLRNGFVMVEGQSGRWYRLAPGHSSAVVYERGKKIASVCIQLNAEFPPTDALIMRCLLCWNAEDDFWKIGNVYRVTNSKSDRVRQKSQFDERPLPVILSELRKRYPSVPLLAEPVIQVA